MSEFKGFGKQEEKQIKKLKEEVNRSVKKLKRLLRKPTIVAGLLDKSPEP